MILIINLCKEGLHYLEFVKPVEDIVKSVGKDCFVRHYLELSNADIERADKIIICGTSLKDEEYLKQLNKFNFLKDTNKSILGICAGMQVICLIFGGKLKKQTEIGMIKVRFKRDFLGLKGEQEVYSLHNYSALPTKEFEVIARGICIQAVKHRQREIYGVLFHPEVRQKGLVEAFVRG